MATRSEPRGGSAGRSGRAAAGGRAGGSLRDHPNLKNIAADFIREGIVSGRFGPGAKVDQDDVAILLGISRLPVREALIELTEKDFVTAIPRRGAFVIDLGVEDIDDHYQVLGMVFALAAGRASKSLTRAQLRDLRSIHEEAEATDNPEAQERLNHEFYFVINRAGSSPRMLSILRSLAGALPGRYYLASTQWSRTESTYREKILVALESRDATAASKVAVEHLTECGRVTIEELRERGYWSTDQEAAATAERRKPRRQPG